MKQFKTVLFITIFAILGFCSCEQMMYVESDRDVYAENNRLDSPNDSVFSLVGILNKFQLLGDQYVLLGELRAELMDVTHNATQDMVDLSQLDYSNPDNEFLQLSNYYAVINNCNYLIQTMDTSIVVQGEQPLLREQVAAKAIRAWTYLQLALNYNGAYYYEQPILTVAEAQAVSSDPANFYTKNDIFAALEADLKPVMDYPMPTYSIAGTYSAQQLIPSVRYILGEIYLWQNRYDEAAEMYYRDILNEEKVATHTKSSVLEEIDFGVNAGQNDPYTNNFVNGYRIRDQWSAVRLATDKVMTYYYGNDYGRFNASKMFRYTYSDFCLAPSAHAINWFASQPYLHYGVTERGESVNIATTGDLRGFPGSFKRLDSNISSMSMDGMSVEEMSQMEQVQLYQEALGTMYISRYTAFQDVVFQSPELSYLRYAEAINRAGKPTVALAVINNGLNLSTITDSMIINPSEMDSALTAQWGNQIFLDNEGLRTRGQGLSTRVRFFFDKDPADVTRQDSILFVEQALLDECGFETAYLGNRFHDLLRFTNHGEGAPNYIANALSQKFPDRAGEFMAKTVEDWYIPYPTQAE